MPADPPLAELAQHELDCVLPAFNADVAWELGQIARKNALKFSNAVLISITAANGLVLFQTATRPGVSLDNVSWVERKRRVVTRFNKSSFNMGCDLRASNTPLSLFGITEADYAFHGGAFPLRVTGNEGLVGILVVSGLHQHEDHQVCVDSIKEFVTKA